VPSVVGVRNTPVVFNQYVTIDFEITEHGLPDGVETITSVVCPSIPVLAVACYLCSMRYITNVVVQGDTPADLDLDPSRDNNMEFPPEDIDENFGPPNFDQDEFRPLNIDEDDDAGLIFPPLDRDDHDHGMYIILLVLEEFIFNLTKLCLSV
jgi:hypothetical protein